MGLHSLDKNELKYELLSLMDTVAHHLKTEPDVDKFLDETDLFTSWEDALPEAEFPIFVMAVLNNMRREAIMNTILKAIRKTTEKPAHVNENTLEVKKTRSHEGEHPFS